MLLISSELPSQSFFIAFSIKFIKVFYSSPKFWFLDFAKVEIAIYSSYSFSLSHALKKFDNDLSER